MKAIWPCLILTILSHAAAAPAPTASPRTFAVFSASFVKGGPGEVRGGVGGTAFFISPTLAVTAHHVLSPSVFQAPEGRRHRTWLVRENFRAIEIKPEYLTFYREKDLTIIRLPESEAVPSNLVYPAFTGAVGDVQVESHGFVANSAGPRLAWVNGAVDIVGVPALQRRHMTGRVLREAQINLHAQDVVLKDAPCVQLSYEPIVGMSGGPVVVGGAVLGMNSFGDPGTRQQSWAVRFRF